MRTYMHERIKKLRKTLDLTQQEFAEKLGIKRNTIAQYEIGRNIPIDAVIKSICREFGVSEEWLRDGIGEMFEEIPEEDVYSRAAAEALKNDDALAIEGMKLYYSLSPEARKAAEEYILKLADLIREHRNTEKE